MCIFCRWWCFHFLVRPLADQILCVGLFTTRWENISYIISNLLLNSSSIVIVSFRDWRLCTLQSGARTLIHERRQVSGAYKFTVMLVNRSIQEKTTTLNRLLQKPIPVQWVVPDRSSLRRIYLWVPNQMEWLAFRAHGSKSSRWLVTTIPFGIIRWKATLLHSNELVYRTKVSGFVWRFHTEIEHPVTY